MVSINLLTNSVKEIIDELNSDGQFYSIRCFVQDFVELLYSPKGRAGRIRIKHLARKGCAHLDIIALLLPQITRKMHEMGADDVGVKSNLIALFTALALPTELDRMNLMCEEEQNKIDVTKKRILVLLQKAWMELFHRVTFSTKMLRPILIHFVENVIDGLPNPELFSDFLYKIFKLGGFMACLSLAGIFKLIVNRNFEHPNFYADVYKIIQPSVCYSDYSKRFFDLVDLILSSTHIPVYIVCAFIKKLSRVLLFAPVRCQLPLIHLLKNLLCRHPTVHSLLVNRDSPQTIDSDPYVESETDLQNCGATESSLWELKAIQSHWSQKVSSKANFVEANVQDGEVSLEWNSLDLFDAILEKSRFTLFDGNPKNDSAGEFENDGESFGLDNGEGGPPKKRRKYSPDESKIQFNSSLSSPLFSSEGPILTV